MALGLVGCTLISLYFPELSVAHSSKILAKLDYTKQVCVYCFHFKFLKKIKTEKRLTLLTLHVSCFLATCQKSLGKLLSTPVWNIPKFRDRLNCSGDTVQPRRRHALFTKTSTKFSKVFTMAKEGGQSIVISCSF